MVAVLFYLSETSFHHEQAARLSAVVRNNCCLLHSK